MGETHLYTCPPAPVSFPGEITGRTWCGFWPFYAFYSSAFIFFSLSSKGSSKINNTIRLNSNGMSSDMLYRGVQPAAHGPHVAQDGYECDPTQNCKVT